MSYRPRHYVTDNTSAILTFKPYARVLTTMRPDQFLSLVPHAVDHEPSIIKVKERLLTEQPLDPLFLDVDVDSGRVLKHEGRHRAKVASSLGIDKVPVVVFAKDGKKNFISVKGLSKEQKDKLKRVIG